jgi:hypothetical protein
VTTNLPGPTADHLTRTYILDRMKEQQYCEVSQAPLVMDDTFLVRVMGTDEELLVSGRGLRQLFIHPEDMEVISAETGLPIS